MNFLLADDALRTFLDPMDQALEAILAQCSIVFLDSTDNASSVKVCISEPEMTLLNRMCIKLFRFVFVPMNVCFLNICIVGIINNCNDEVHQKNEHEELLDEPNELDYIYHEL